MVSEQNHIVGSVLISIGFWTKDMAVGGGGHVLLIFDPFSSLPERAHNTLITSTISYNT